MWGKKGKKLTPQAKIFQIFLKIVICDSVNFHFGGPSLGVHFRVFRVNFDLGETKRKKVFAAKRNENHPKIAKKRETRNEISPSPAPEEVLHPLTGSLRSPITFDIAVFCI